MREIKFRAWANNRMRYDVTGFEHGNKNEMEGIFLDGNYYTMLKDKYSQHQYAIVEQYTGLKDKNGKEIYEGDIVQSDATYYDVHRVYKTVVEWNNDIENDSFGDPLTAGYCIIGHNIEVVGNIHETPELLK